MDDNKYSLRERKYAKTKIGLANAFMERLKTTRFSDIPIKDVCYSVEVSEGTFYNYFPQKLDVINYFQYLHLLKVEWEIKNKSGNFNSLDLIEQAMESLAEAIKHPYFFYEIVSVFTSEHIKPQQEELTLAEKYYAFPDCRGIEDIEIESLESFFLKHLKAAQKEGIIINTLPLKDMVVILKTILIGTPLAVELEDFQSFPDIIKKQMVLFRKNFEVKL
ncbi:MAG: hypothetical protein PHZ27_00315 [Candidatus Omnitrophica bacterium]|nr:hypothetical protein [Candidatus Omnitrophota bacterium]MDD5440639.1 hypothetical protein [Candidatus Omnitrophota bacterium]